MRPERYYVRALSASFALLCIACSDDTTSPPTPRALEIVEGDGQQARLGEPLPTALRVRVIGSDEQPLAGATVQWAATIGTATITPTQSVTNNNGDAETRVVLESVGNVLVSAVAPGILPVTFSLTGLDPCETNSWPVIELGTTVAGHLQPRDCEAHGGRFHDLYPFFLSTQQAVIMGVQSSTFDPVVELHTGEPWYFLADDSVNATRDARAKAILPPGGYLMAASSMDAGATGPYNARLIQTSPSQESCEFVMVMAGISTTQTLASTDCADPSGRPEDRFWLVIPEGWTVTVTQSSRHVTPHLRLIRNEEVVAEADGAETGPAMLTYTSDVFTSYWVHASSSGGEQLGEYTLFITNGGGGSTRVSTPREIGPLGRLGLRERAMRGVRPRNLGQSAAASHR